MMMIMMIMMMMMIVVMINVMIVSSDVKLACDATSGQLIEDGMR